MSETAPAEPKPAGPPRFSWGVRIVLFLVLFHMLFRSTDVLYPWEDWLWELKVKRMPRALPTREDLEKKRAEAGGSNDPVLKEFRECGESLVKYWNPTPSDETRPLLNSATDWGKYGLVWTASRLQWCECILGIDQEWPMFSPNVGRRKYASRARLRFEDGSEVTIRQRSEPEDYTSFSRWRDGKNLGYDRFVLSDHGRRYEACPGYANFLSHRYPRNDAGSPLEAIIFYEVKLDFPPPDKDAREFLKQQMELTKDYNARQAYWAFFVYFPKDRTWKFLARERKEEGEPEFYSRVPGEGWKYLGSRDPYPLPATPEKFQNLIP